DPAIWISIEKGAREAPISNTPVEYMELYKRCWDTEPDQRPNISEIVTRLSTMRLEPVYDPPSSVNSISLNSYLSSIIGTDHNSTLTFDDKFVISLKSNDETPDYEWDEETCRWERVSNTKVIVRYSKESTSDISMWLKEVN
ncbi:5913_t:CDS:2, partial [Dentiscutata heterogama]